MTREPIADSVRCPDCGETDFTDDDRQAMSHFCPLYMEPTYRRLTRQINGSGVTDE